ncbi:MAG: chemotaxis protein CheA [Zetaproteobacteria bacterium]|nr:chemotaxis protein CheA [Zetaproteobacteria bacterium]
MDSPGKQVSEGDDEHMMLLEQLAGGDSGNDAVEAPASLTAPSTEAEMEDGVEEDEAVEEIEEFGQSEFGSDPEMIKDFLVNGDDLMENLDEQILKLEESPNDIEIINEIFRSAHTLKGAAGMFGYRAIERIMHRMENYFDQIAKGKQQVTGDATDVILQAMDILRVLIDAVRQGKPSGEKTAPIVRVLNQLCAGKLKAGAVKKKVSGAKSEDKAPEKAGAEAVKKTAQSTTIRVDLQRLDALVNLVGELVIDRTRFSNIEEQLRTGSSVALVAGNMSETVQLFGRHMNEVQDIIMKVRMVPIGNAFNKFNRVVRDLSKSLEKEIDLIIEGEQTELDKTIVEQIGDPLIHLVRNAVDHGIEMPEVRTSAGKSARGTIVLSARQEGNQIMINIEDDGKGMDQEVIRQKGIERGLISEDDQLSERDVFNLIFEPGFSTAAAVTNISGRGVGMDVVKKEISKLKGVIEIQSKLGAGSTITIQLPLTLAIVQSLLVRANEDIFAIPLSSVIESLRIQPDEIQMVGDAEVIKRRDRVLPLLYLSDALDLGKKNDHVWYRYEKESKKSDRRKEMGSERLFVVVVGTADRSFGLVVDSLLNQQEMVIKSMGDIMGDINCVAGGAILGNGEVVLVLDIGELEQQFRIRSRVAAV